MPDSWVTDKPKITDAVHLKCIEQHINRGPIYLRHAFYHGGGSPHWEMIASYQKFMGHIAHSNAGDWFYVWSIPDLITKNLHFLHRPYENFDLSLDSTKKDFSEIKKFLIKGREALLIFLPIQTDDGEAVFKDLETYEELIEVAGKFSKQSLELYAFDMEDLWNPKNILVDAKVANASGQVPIGGAY